MRSTRTNSGRESRGVVRFGKWELEGEAYLLVVCGALGSIFVFLLAHSSSLAVRLAFASVPLALAVLWLRLFVVGKPPHYTSDYFEGLLTGRDFSIDPLSWRACRHPRRVVVPGREGGI